MCILNRLEVTARQNEPLFSIFLTHNNHNILNFFASKAYDFLLSEKGIPIQTFLLFFSHMFSHTYKTKFIKLQGNLDLKQSSRRTVDEFPVFLSPDDIYCTTS